MSTCFKNLINESKEDISFEKISDLELGMEVIGLERKWKF